MTLTQTIEKAIESGWGLDGVPRSTDAEYVSEKIIEVALLDPLFWQALYGSKKYGRLKAREFINCLFDDETAEQFFGKEMLDMPNSSQ